MTPTPNPTAERVCDVIAKTIRRVDGRHSMGAGALGEHIEEALRAHGLLSEGTPSEEQVERAAREWYEQANGYETWASASGQHQQVVRVRAAKALTAAGVTPQESATQPVEEERLGGTPLLDPEKVAQLVRLALRSNAALFDPPEQVIARALCEAHQEGRLTDG